MSRIEGTASKDGTETDLVEGALRRFGKLLQLAFGEAGASVMAQCLSKDGDVNAMVREDVVAQGGASMWELTSV